MESRSDIISRKNLNRIIAVLFLPLTFILFETVIGRQKFQLAGHSEMKPLSVSDLRSLHTPATQKKLEDHLSQLSGLRWALIRLRNEIHYIFFNKVYVNKVVLQKENIPFEQDHIDAWSGRDFLPAKQIDDWLEKTKTVDQILNQKRIRFFVVLAPSKASFLPEKILGVQVRAENNYSRFREGLKKKRIPMLDLQEWYSAQKKNYPEHVLMPKYSTHWSVFGATLAMIELEKAIQKILHVPLVDVKLRGYTSFQFPQFANDGEIYNSMNLIFPRHRSEYRTWNIEYFEFNKIRPRVIIISDSFYYAMGLSGVPQKIFADHSQFWYYDQTAIDLTSGIEMPVVSVNFAEQLRKTDVIILLVSEVNLKYFGYGFLERLIQKNSEPLQ